jgi:hypothetical protein
VVEHRRRPGDENGSGDALTIVWGSPNDNNPAATNIVSFYSGANGTGSLIGQVLASDLYSNFSDINNTQDPGFLVSFMTPEKDLVAVYIVINSFLSTRWLIKRDEPSNGFRPSCMQRTCRSVKSSGRPILQPRRVHQ